MQIDHDEIMRRVAAISPTLSAHAHECDVARKLTGESIAAMVDAGMFRIPTTAPGWRLRAEPADGWPTRSRRSQRRVRRLAGC